MAFSSTNFFLPPDRRLVGSLSGFFAAPTFSLFSLMGANKTPEIRIPAEASSDRLSVWCFMCPERNTKFQFKEFDGARHSRLIFIVQWQKIYSKSLSKQILRHSERLLVFLLKMTGLACWSADDQITRMTNFSRCLLSVQMCYIKVAARVWIDQERFLVHLNSNEIYRFFCEVKLVWVAILWVNELRPF